MSQKKQSFSPKRAQYSPLTYRENNTLGPHPKSIDVETPERQGTDRHAVPAVPLSGPAAEMREAPMFFRLHHNRLVLASSVDETGYGHDMYHRES